MMRRVLLRAHSHVEWVRYYIVKTVRTRKHWRDEDGNNPGRFQICRAGQGQYLGRKDCGIILPRLYGQETLGGRGCDRSRALPNLSYRAGAVLRPDGLWENIGRTWTRSIPGAFEFVAHAGMILSETTMESRTNASLRGNVGLQA